MCQKHTHESGRLIEAVRLIEAGKTGEARSLIEAVAEQVHDEGRRTALTAAAAWAKKTASLLDPDHRAECIADRRGLTPSDREAVSMLADAHARLARAAS